MRAASESDYDLVADSVSKIYNASSKTKTSVTALDEVSLSVSKNEFLVLIGPSGCGKTTMLHIFAGLVEPTSGQALFQGEPIDGPNPDRAVVFQHFNLFPWRTVYKNVTFGLEMEGYPEEEQRELAQRYIDLVGLKGFEDSYPSELSGGMQQRVGLARALSVDPSVLLMDEPFGALDAQTRETMQTELLEIWEEEQKTILFVTHDIEEAILLGDRILVLGANPHSIQEEVEVPFERPRYGRDLATASEFQELKGELWEILKRSSVSGSS